MALLQPTNQTWPAPSYTPFADDGTKLTCTNTTVSTGLTWPVATVAFTDTGPNFWIHNNEVQGGRTLYLDYLELISTAVGTGAVSWQYAVIIDPIPRTCALGVSTQMVAITVNCPNTQAGPIAAPSVWAQNTTTQVIFSASSASSKLVARGMIGGINIAGHLYSIQFGNFDGCTIGGTGVGATDTAAAPGKSGDASGPVGIGPGSDCSIYIWGPSSSASINPEFELGMIARY